MPVALVAFPVRSMYRHVYRTAVFGSETLGKAHGQFPPLGGAQFGRKAISHSRAVRASLRFSAISAAFHSAARDQAPAPSRQHQFRVLDAGAPGVVMLDAWRSSTRRSAERYAAAATALRPELRASGLVAQ